MRSLDFLLACWVCICGGRRVIQGQVMRAADNVENFYSSQSKVLLGPMEALGMLLLVMDPATAFGSLKFGLQLPDRRGLAGRSVASLVQSSLRRKDRRGIAYLAAPLEVTENSGVANERASESFVQEVSPVLAELDALLQGIGVPREELLDVLCSLPADDEDEIMLAAAVGSPAMATILQELNEVAEKDVTPELLAEFIAAVEPSYQGDVDEEAFLRAATRKLIDVHQLVKECASDLDTHGKARAAAAISLISVEDKEDVLLRALPSTLERCVDELRPKLPLWSDSELQSIVLDSVATDMLDLEDESSTTFATEESIEEFITWLTQQVDASELEEWRNCNVKLYQLAEPDDDEISHLHVAD